MNELQPCISQHWLLTGAETSTYCVHGLWERPLGDFTAFLRKEGFNALRLPLSAELMLNLDGTQPNGINFQANPELQVHLVGLLRFR
jgi:aryl-phospho-beta-D-glucosidase BglC (GH1 family)